VIFMFYIVATPIGNLKDLSQRAVEALSLADFIVCERPNHSLKILSFWGIKRKTLVAFTESNKRFSIPKIIGLLKTGKTACFIVDAGTPGVSDPGSELVAAVREQGIKILSVPGPSALSSAIPLTGERISKFLFAGFLPRKKKELLEFLELAKNNDFCLVGYESPFRLEKTLALVPESFKVVLVSEISKLHEKVLKGTAKEILAQFESDKNLKKGEFVVFFKPQS